jgi:hypothetical protein
MDKFGRTKKIKHVGIEEELIKAEQILNSEIRFEILATKSVKEE